MSLSSYLAIGVEMMYSFFRTHRGTVSQLNQQQRTLQLGGRAKIIECNSHARGIEVVRSATIQRHVAYLTYWGRKLQLSVSSSGCLRLKYISSPD